jgi:hypothetical protein
VIVVGDGEPVVGQRRAQDAFAQGESALLVVGGNPGRCSNSSGSLEQRGSAVDWIEALPYCGLQASGTLSYLGMSPTPGTDWRTMAIPGTDWKTMNCSGALIFGVKKNGTLWGMGAGPYGQGGRRQRLAEPAGTGTHGADAQRVSVARGPLSLPALTGHQHWNITRWPAPGAA